MIKHDTVTRGLPPAHPWLRPLRVAFDLASPTRSVAETASGLQAAFERLGHQVDAAPGPETEVVIANAGFGQPISWRRAPLFMAGRRYGMTRTPTVVTLISASAREVDDLLERLGRSLTIEAPSPSDFDYPGVAPRAHEVFIEQGRRGGPILALTRLLQAQSKCLRIVLLVGDEAPERAYHFDLVGAHPVTVASDPPLFYEDMALRVATAAGVKPVVEHEQVAPPVSRAEWERLATPQQMCRASAELNARDFFTAMLRVADLVAVPMLGDAVAEQYSEGCFATWDPVLGALVATVTGSARPVNKGRLTPEELAVIVGVRPEATGALVRVVEGQETTPPSSEAVEMMGVDGVLPTRTLGDGWTISAEVAAPIRVPAARSKLHGHRGISAYHPDYVEFLPLDAPYYHYPVSCGSDAQARGITNAFARSVAMADPDDPRQVAFTVLPGHGVVIAEKWVAGKDPLQAIWEYMDAGYLVVEKTIPQGMLTFEPGADGRRHLHESG